MAKADTTYVCPECGAQITTFGGVQAWCTGDGRKSVLAKHKAVRMKEKKGKRK